MSHCQAILIEDHDLTRATLKLSLERTGKVKVLADAATGAEGLNFIQTHRPDVAIVDVGLPDLDGIEVTRRIKMQADPFCPRVLILTLRGSEETVLAAFAAGADSYCMKDAPIATLVDALQMTAEGNSWIDPGVAGIVLRHMRQLQPNSSAFGDEPSLNTGTGASAASSLTERELEVLQLIVDGYNNAAIAEQLYIGIGTVKTHVRHILTKLSADDRTQAAVRALRTGLAR